METRFKVTGVVSTIAMLRYNAVAIPDKARKTMHRIADRIVKGAKLNAPVDLHNLEDSIHKVARYESRGRLALDIEMGGEVNGVNVDEYAMEVHEHYESMIAKNGPGDGTAAKRLENPNRYVGEKFLERAFDDEKQKIPAEILRGALAEIER